MFATDNGWYQYQSPPYLVVGGPPIHYMWYLVSLRHRPRHRWSTYRPFVDRFRPSDGSGAVYSSPIPAYSGSHSRSRRLALPRSGWEDGRALFSGRSGPIWSAPVGRAGPSWAELGRAERRFGK